MMLEQIKRLLKIEDNTHDGMLSFLIDSTKEKILNYCNRNDFPDGLKNVLIEMVITQYREQNGSGNVQSIKRGDTQITYASGSFNLFTGSGGADFIKNYKAQLNRYRKVGTL